MERIRKHNEKLNAIVILTEKEALKRAQEADEALSNGKIWGPMHGVPITIKECFDVAGLKSTVNSKQFKNYVANEDAPVVMRLKNAGAIILGKTNVPTMLADHQTYGPIYPRANNPYNTKYTPGGSTGGGAAAVAAGFTPLEIGNDILGSIRIPSHFCGVYGLKPTENTIPMRGNFPRIPGARGGIVYMANIGPLARSLADLRLAFDVISGPDYREVRVAPIHWKKNAGKQLSEYNLVWSDSFGELQASRETCSLLEDLVSKISGQGGNISKLDSFQFDFEKAWEIWGNIFGFLIGQDMPAVIRLLMKMQYKYSMGTILGEGVAKGLGLNFKRFARIISERYELIAQLQAFFDQYDFWLCPVAMTPAFSHRKKGKPIEIDGRRVPYFYATSIFVSVFNVSGHPAVIVPLGQSKKGLPIGLQIVGPYWSEPQLIKFAQHLSELTQGFTPPKDYVETE